MNPTRPRRLTRALLSVPLAVAVAVSLAACSSGGSSDDKGTASSSGGLGAAAEQPSDSLAGNAADGDRSAKDAPASSAAIQRAVIATATLSLSTKDPLEARSRAIGVVTGLDGLVTGEQTASDGHGLINRVDLVVRVPSARFESALDQLSLLGVVRDRQQSAEDVTTQVIDNDARVATQRASVASIQRLMARARTIGEIMSIESQLATRQADLDSLVQQQRYLSDQTTLSTINVAFTRPATSPKKPATNDRDGFLGGLDDGWHALGDTLQVVGQVAGALLPFAAVMALVGLPAWLVVRRRRIGLPGPASDG
jgi:hypothetical protein